MRHWRWPPPGCCRATLCWQCVGWWECRCGLRLEAAPAPSAPADVWQCLTRALPVCLPQELHRAHATALAGQGQHEQAAAHHMAAGQWASASAALCARGTATAAAAAVKVCRQALADPPTGLSAHEEGKLRSQQASAEERLAQLAAAEGSSPEAVLAALAPPQQRAAGEGAPAGGGGPAQRRYTPEQLMAAQGAAPDGGLAGLPDDLASEHHPAAAALDDPAVFGRSGAARQRYSLQTLLLLGSGAADSLTPQQLACLPADLRSDS